MVMSNSPRQPLDPPDAPPRSPPPFLGSTRGHLLLGHFRPELLLENIQNYINLKLTTNWFVLELPGDLRRGKHQMEERRNTLNWSLVHSPGSLHRVTGVTDAKGCQSLLLCLVTPSTLVTSDVWVPEFWLWRAILPWVRYPNIKTFI